MYRSLYNVGGIQSQSGVNEGGEGVIMLEVGRARSVGPYSP